MSPSVKAERLLWNFEWDFCEMRPSHKCLSIFEINDPCPCARERSNKVKQGQAGQARSSVQCELIKPEINSEKENLTKARRINA